VLAVSPLLIGVFMFAVFRLAGGWALFRRRDGEAEACWAKLEGASHLTSIR